MFDWVGSTRLDSLACCSWLFGALTRVNHRGPATVVRNLRLACYPPYEHLPYKALKLDTLAEEDVHALPPPEGVAAS